jgi:hypothetical protein
MFLISSTGNKFIQQSKRKKLLNLTSLGYIAPGLRSGSKPDQPSMLSSFFGTENLSGSNSFGRSQKYGDLWRLYICSARIYHKLSNGLDWTEPYSEVKSIAICVAQFYPSHFKLQLPKLTETNISVPAGTSYPSFAPLYPPG